jgi:4-amino-4-deoxy-L-arabinose transferase-like glycosyltransferase
VRRSASRRFWTLLGLILVVAAGVRVAYVLGVADGFNRTRFYDAAFYELQARVVADGKGFVDPFNLLPGRSQELVPAADHPPLTVFVLAPVAKVWDSQLPMRWASALAGLAVVALTALLARAVAGDAAGLIAGGLAAIYPFLWVNDGLIMSESFTGVFVVGTLLASYFAMREPDRWWRWVLAGLLGGLAALGRAELVLLVPFIGAGVVVTRRAGGWRTRLIAVGAMAVSLLVVLTPWFLYNQSRFDRPVLLSTNDGLAMVASNCDAMYHGPGIGLTNLNGPPCLPKPPSGDQSVVAAEYRTKALRYMRDHAGRVPVVVLARAGRDWSLYRPGQMLAWNESEGRPSWVTGLGMVMYYPLLIGAVIGAVLLWRRRAWLWPLLVPGIVVTVGTLFAYGQTRFRAPAEPCIVVLAAVALAAIGRRAPNDPSADATVDASAVTV